MDGFVGGAEGSAAKEYGNVSGNTHKSGVLDDREGVDVRVTTGGHEVAREDPEGGRLAGPVDAQQAKALPGPQCEAEPLQHGLLLPPAVRLRQAAHKHGGLVDRRNKHRGRTARGLAHALYQLSLPDHVRIFRPVLQIVNRTRISLFFIVNSHGSWIPLDHGIKITRF